jgi:type IV pilus assembly protein PilO
VKNIDLGSLDFNNIGAWPMPLKITLIALVSLAVAVAGYFLFIQGQRTALQQHSQQEQNLKHEIEGKQAKANNLEQLRDQIVKIQDILNTMERQLPKKTEVDALLNDISEKGIGNGVKFQLFKPQAERFNGSIAEYPIQMKVTGSYHEFGGFVSEVAALPRIVTLHDINIIDDKKSKKLTMELVAKTYRYLEAEELQSQQQKTKSDKIKK